jgi:high-affinity K+ transport system ATPase subunit B
VGREAFVWSAFLALLCGLLAGLGMFRSVRRVFGVTVAFMLWQVAFWTVLLTFARPDERTADADWNTDLLVSFFLSLVAVIPYTTIGAVLSATGVALARRFGGGRRAEKW